MKKTHLGLRYKHKKSNFACKIFFSQKFIIEHKSKFATKKGIKNFLPQICVFAYEKMHIILFSYMKII